MPRYIDADELLNNIEEVIDIENDGQDVKKSKLIILGLKIAKKYIKKACTIEAEPDNGWISVKDRLPDNVEEVLIYCPEFCEEIKQATWCGEDFFVEREDLIVEPAPNGYCTHWMPLPEPPKEDKDEIS